MFLVVLVATICSYLEIDTSWYEGLKLLAFVPSVTAMSILWAFNYCMHIFVLTRAVLQRISVIKTLLLVFVEIFWIGFYVSFWHFHNVGIALAMLAMLVIYMVVVGIFVLKCDSWCVVWLCVEIAIICYLATSFFWQFYIG